MRLLRVAFVPILIFAAVVFLFVLFFFVFGLFPKTDIVSYRAIRGEEF